MLNLLFQNLWTLTCKNNEKLNYKIYCIAMICAKTVNAQKHFYEHIRIQKLCPLTYFEQSVLVNELGKKGEKLFLKRI